jgi:lysophospholipase L1-like esterase
VGKQLTTTLAVVASAALVLAATSCSTSSGGGTSTLAKPRQAPQYYVSLGDSYAAGYQPTGPRGGHTDRNGFAYQVPALAAAKGYDLRLVNFGCSGATTESILSSRGCALPGPGSASYRGQTQAGAAEAFLKSHRGRIGLITVSIGGNDVTRCAFSSQPLSCLTAAVAKIGRNVATLVAGLRAAAGPSVPLVGTTYPDVLLGLYLSAVAPLRSLAALSVTGFKELLNPVLKRTYAAAGGSFADVTAATGAYRSLSDMTELKPYGRIPLPVARVCQLTFFCQYHDIHPRTAGYRLIAELVVDALPRRR